MTKYEKQIIDILDNDFYTSPDDIIQEKEPYYWRFRKGWLNRMAKEISKLEK